MNLVPKIEKRITSGNIWSAIIAVCAVLGGTGYSHFNPSTAEQKASDDSTAAVQRATEAATKAATVQTMITQHAQQIEQIKSTCDSLAMDVAILKIQGTDRKAADAATNSKLDELLKMVYRLQGQYRANEPSGKQGPGS